MRKNVIFVFVFAAVIIGLVQLHTLSLKKVESQSVNVQGIANILYPADVEVRNDIPFELLVNQDDKKLLPDSVDYEKYRPHLILLAKGFDEKDSEQLKEFPNIVVNAQTLDNFDPSILEAEYAASLSNNMHSMVQQNAERTSSSILDWKVIPVAKAKDVRILKVEYKLVNQKKKVLNIRMAYLFKGNKQVEVTLAAPDKDLKKWTPIYNEILNNISIN